MKNDSKHFDVSFNRKTRKKGFFLNNAYKKDITYILGIGCIDGVVLVGRVVLSYVIHENIILSF